MSDTGRATITCPHCGKTADLAGTIDATALGEMLRTGFTTLANVTGETQGAQEALAKLVAEHLGEIRTSTRLGTSILVQIAVAMDLDISDIFDEDDLP